MRHLKTLVVTKHATRPSILNWQVLTVDNVETAIEKFQQDTYHVLAISENINETDSNKLKKIITMLSPEAIILDYKDEGILSDEVKTAYWSKNKPGMQRRYLDNAFDIKLACSLH
ncbi:hypothetical protein IA57_12045 [Mangrovimonas yunxiaonensis]|uniref:Uncharacterized protein n=1 Tax=Mangrovimonas yunxiaonensis TaxID=1197477 RepID=A0A084THG8_9FLAO|nr:hypothetical protein [Mangrovimonas yunxiaonensis]KFB00154.1 hypothetical protein IA57_12045 [Mangrovimonas yunxiaonensis]GGH42224.1 hypothetical protein GCM10011364_13570 [Mangrovimonas yunxiaonensis]